MKTISRSHGPKNDTHPTSYPVDTGDSFPRSKVAGALGQECTGLQLHYPIYIHGVGFS